MDIIGLVAVLIVCAIACVGLVEEIKRYKVCVKKEHEQAMMYEEIRDLLRRFSSAERNEETQQLFTVVGEKPEQ